VASIVAVAGETAEITPMLDRPPLTCSRDSGMARCVRDAASAVTGAAPEEWGVVRRRPSLERRRLLRSVAGISATDRD